MFELPQLLESILFQNAQPMSYQQLAQITEKSTEEVQQAIVTLKDQLQGRGVALVSDNIEVLMVTHPLAESVLSKFRAEALEGPLSKSAVETLAIIVYRGPLAKTDIDYIRGVNSSLVLRTLLTRGLIERDTSPTDKRMIWYKPTLDALAFLGVSQQTDLPDYDTINQQFNAIHHESSK